MNTPDPAVLADVLQRHDQVLCILPEGHDPLALRTCLPENLFVLSGQMSAPQLQEEWEHIRERLWEERRVRVVCTADSFSSEAPELPVVIDFSRKETPEHPRPPEIQSSSTTIPYPSMG